MTLDFVSLLEKPAPAIEKTPLLEVRDVVVEFGNRTSFADRLLGRRAQYVRALDSVSFGIGRGETLGLVGESGSGKTTLARAIVGLCSINSGDILLDGSPITSGGSKARYQRAKQVQLVFQDPYGSLNPRMTIAGAISEILRVHNMAPIADIPSEVRRLLMMVGLTPDLAQRRPHALSGGQRQRVGLSRALAIRPRLLVLDEPVASLDVSIQAQVLNLLSDMAERFQLTMLLIAHELGVVKHMADRVAVMYLGRIIEIGSVDEVFSDPRHPYTRGLLAASPKMKPVKRNRKPALLGDIPSPLAIPKGCHFRACCPMAKEICAEIDPRLTQISPTHKSACHLTA